MQKMGMEQVPPRSCYIVQEQDFEFHVRQRSQYQDPGVRFRLQFLNSAERTISGMAVGCLFAFFYFILFFLLFVLFGFCHYELIV